MADPCDEDNGSGPISRSSVTHVAYLVGKFDEQKRELVREIGFGGILDLPQITKVDRKFTLWLLSNLDPEQRSIIVNGEPVADVIDFEVARIMGIPCGRRKVCPLECDKKSKAQFIQNIIGSSDTENNSLAAAENNVKAQYDLTKAMSMKDKQNFKVSFVVWVMGHLLAPTKKYNVGADRFWGALLHPDEIKEFNWSAYVVDELLNAARDVQDAMKQNKTINTITGCPIVLQILYLESINLGSFNRPKGILPRVKAYDGKSLSAMIAADKASSSSGSGNATWGSSVRQLPEDPEPIQMPNSDVNNQSHAENTIITDLGKYVRQNFGDKVTSAQSVALNWFHARCLSHYKQLRLSIQEDTIALVGKLFGSPTHAVASQAARSNSTGARHAHSEPSRQAHSEPTRTILKNKRPYGSSSTPYNRRYRKKYHVSFKHHELPETLLTGVARPVEVEVADQQSDSGFQSRNASQCSGSSIDAPSFDLGIEFNEETNEHTPLPSSTNHSVPKQAICPSSSADMNMSSALPQASPSDNIAMFPLFSVNDSPGISLSLSNENCVGSSNPVCFNTLSGTPPSAKSITKPQFTTPDKRFAMCNTSPGSLSKILAEGDLVDRMTSCEDTPNINIKPWDDGYSDEHIEKRIMCTPEIPESPWSYNLSHRNPPKDLVKKFFDDVSTCDFSKLNRPWLAHTSPRHIEIDGIWIRKSFIPESGMSYDVFDLAIRRLKQLDDIMYSETTSLYWRHILESEFAIFALSGEIPYNRKTIIEQFVGPSLRYKLENCRMIVVPAYILLNWSSYIFDFKDKCVHVIDPLYNKEDANVFDQIHRPNIHKIAVTLLKCFVMFFENFHHNLHDWPVNFLEPPIVDATLDETGLLNLMYIRQFDGCKFHLVNRDYFCHFKKVMLYELMSLSENHVKPPLNMTITIDD